jgi:hypothetical protein
MQVWFLWSGAAVRVLGAPALPDQLPAEESLTRAVRGATAAAADTCPVSDQLLGQDRDPLLHVRSAAIRADCRRAAPALMPSSAHVSGNSTPQRSAPSVSSRRAAARTAAVVCGGADLVGLVWLIASLVITASPPAASRPLYTIAAVRRHLHDGPTGWIGRTIEVRAVATLCATWLSGAGSPCLDQQPRLDDLGGHGSIISVPLADASASPLLAALRRLPLLGPLAPSPQPLLLHWGIPWVYTIRLQRTPCAGDAAQMCDQAVIVRALWR